MTITMKTEGTAATLHVEGWLDTQSSARKIIGHI